MQVLLEFRDVINYQWKCDQYSSAQILEVQTNRQYYLQPGDTLDLSPLCWDSLGSSREDVYMLQVKDGFGHVTNVVFSTIEEMKQRREEAEKRKNFNICRKLFDGYNLSQLY